MNSQAYAANELVTFERPDPNKSLSYPIIRAFETEEKIQFRLVSTPDKRHQFVRITQSGLVLGDISDSMTDEVLLGQGLAEALYPDIQEVRFERLGYWTEQYWQRRYTVDRKTDRRLTFIMWERDSENVDRALAAGLGDRFRSKHARLRWSDVDYILLATFAISVSSFYLVVFNWRLLVLPILMTIIWVWVLHFNRKIRNRSEYATSEQRKRHFGDWQGTVKDRRDGSGQPFQSTYLGWNLKLLGLGYALWVLCSPELAMLISKLFDNNSPMALLYQIMYYFLSLPAIGLLYLGSRLCARTFKPGRHVDPRSPVLYLRSFDDDGRATIQPCTYLAENLGVELPKSEWKRTNTPRQLGFLNRIFLSGNLNPIKLLRMLFDARRLTIEDTLGAAFRQIGPFVTIGRPCELIATTGADRMYVSDTEWQKVVLDYLRRCQAVILQPSESEGIRWEVERVFEKVPVHHVLLSMRNFQGRYHEYDMFRSLLAERYGLVLPLCVPAMQELCFVYFEPDRTPRIQSVCYTNPWTWPFTNNAVDEQRTFYTFIQGLNGHERGPPRKPIKYEYQWLSYVIQLGLSVLFFLLLNVMVSAFSWLRVYWSSDG